MAYAPASVQSPHCWLLWSLPYGLWVFAGGSERAGTLQVHVSSITPLFRRGYSMKSPRAPGKGTLSVLHPQL